MTLTTIAADRRCFGADVEAAFSDQAERRQTAATAILDKAQAAQRGDLLASEQRACDTQIRERDSILALIRHIEQRTSDAYRVPASQTIATRTEHDEDSPVLARDQRCLDFVRRRGGVPYAAERGAGQMRFGRVVRAFIFGDRRGLSDLELRALSEGVDAAGGYTVPEILGASFIDRVRNAMVVMRAGAMTVPMTSDTLHLARLAQPGAYIGSPPGSAAVWKVENALVTEANLTLERVTFTARTLPILIKLSIELSEDSANIDAILEREMSQALALELDRAALLGTGTPPEPRGVRNQSGVGVTALNATPTDYDFIVESIGRVWGFNHDPNARLYNASLATLIAKFKSTADAQPLRVPEAVAAVPAFRTNQIPDAGTSPDETTMFVGDWSQLMVGLRTSFRLEATRQAGEAFERMQIWIRAYLRADVQLAHPEAFDVTTDVGV